MMLNTETGARDDEINLRKILHFIREYKGVDLSQYREGFAFRRLRLRIQAAKCRNYLDYIKLLQEKPEEFNRFLDNLSINVTEFFRDTDVFAAFKNILISEIIPKKEAASHRIIRFWSAGCASGEESYSLAMLIKEALGGKTGFVVKIWGTDIDNAALEKARKGEYKLDAKLEKIDKKIMKKYFIPVDAQTCRVQDEIKQMVKFEQCNLSRDPPFNYLDAIFCRNVMIYLSHQQKGELFERFHRLLNPRGYLVLSKVETLWEKRLFETVLPKEKIYRKIGL